MTSQSSQPDHEPRLLPPESSDIQIGMPVAIGVVVAALIVIALVVSAWMLFPRPQTAHSPPSPLAFLDNPTPAPHLEYDPPTDLASLRAHEEKVLTTYGWIDRKAGVYRIPIAEAMKLLAAGRATPATPATPVETPAGDAKTQADEQAP